MTGANILKCEVFCFIAILFEVDTVFYCLGWNFKLPGLHYRRVAELVHKLKEQEQRLKKNSMTRMFTESAKMGMRAMIDLRLKVKDKGLR